jgi:hypothetical protein
MLDDFDLGFEDLGLDLDLDGVPDSMDFERDMTLLQFVLRLNF